MSIMYSRVENMRLTCPVRFTHTIQHLCGMEYERAKPWNEGRREITGGMDRKACRNIECREGVRSSKGVHNDSLRPPVRWVYG
jgi:hypothetical protein